jgi:aspartate/methionine/tyrosine aminotransferase
LGINSKNFCSELVNKYGISLLPGFSFEIKDHFRMNISMKHKKFKKTLNLFQKYIDEILNNL